MIRVAVVTVLCAALLAACGKNEPKSAASSQSATKAALAGAPPELRKLHAQANKLIGGSKPAFDARMAELRGYPVVVNKWASWCPPCRREFPVLQKVSLQLGKRVAFLGVDSQDNDADARKFLKQFPVTYPSYRDPGLKIASKIQAGLAFPTTIFFDKRGELIYAHPGPYRSAAEMIKDIRRYAIA